MTHTFATIVVGLVLVSIAFEVVCWTWDRCSRAFRKAGRP